MSHQPITRARSPWVPTARNVNIAGALAPVTGWRRHVHDGTLAALVADEPAGWHLSISHTWHHGRRATTTGRYPTWDEIAHARYELLPAELDFVMHLPPPDEFVAVHPTCFHLHQHPERTIR